MYSKAQTRDLVLHSSTSSPFSIRHIWHVSFAILLCCPAVTLKGILGYSACCGNGLVSQGSLACCTIAYNLNLLGACVTCCSAMQLSNSEASNGLVLPAVAVVYFGKAGAVLVVIICFMAVTSSGAGEGLACTSLFTFDVYRRYLKPKVHDAPCV